MSREGTRPGTRPEGRAAGRVTPAGAGAVAAAEARSLLDRLAKPRGSLGGLEALAIRLADMYGSCPPPVPEPAVVVVFAADHGVVAEGVTPWPQEVTAQMVGAFCRGERRSTSWPGTPAPR